MSNILKATVGVDLGARCTGLFFEQHKVGEISSKKTEAATIVMPVEGDKYVYSTTARTAVRHRIRGKKRFNLARRLVTLIVNKKIDDLSKQLSLTLDNVQQRKMFEAIFGLLKRRGYARTENEIDLTTLEDLDASVFAKHEIVGKYIADGRSVAEQWEEKTQDLTFVESFINDNLPNKNDFKKFVKAEFPEYDQFKDQYSDALSNMILDAKAISMQQTMGHKHRLEYLESIKKEIHSDTRLKIVCNAFGGEDNFFNLIGNVSNLQLRAERWYFNTPDMLNEDKWIPEKLQQSIVRAFLFFHPEQEQRLEFKKLVEELKSSKDIIQTLCTITPDRTIPPYEDQNNRRPPVDQTLLLNPTSLNKRFNDKWLTFADNFVKQSPKLIESLDKILKYTDRKTRVLSFGAKPYPIEYYKASYVLQRVLDRTRNKDDFALRAIAKEENSKDLFHQKNMLAKVVGEDNLTNFIKFAKDYYEETEAAKKGLWLKTEDSLLERSDIHPPMKSKDTVLSLLVGNILSGDENRGELFINDIWTSIVKGRSTVKSLCYFIEKNRKDLGGEFNYLYQKVKAKIFNKEKISGQEKVLEKVDENVNTIVAFIKDKLNLSNLEAQRIANPFSLAQLYTLIETEKHGFTKTTLAAHFENAWRMSSDSDDELGSDSAQCSRLPADAVRPFDGVLRKSLDRQSWELAKIISGNIQTENNIKNGSVDVTILIEQNKFAFSADIAGLKKNRKAQIKGEKALKNQQNRWVDKDTRIRLASKGVCPYTGKPLSENDSTGEVDHIIPRSATTKQMGMIFNSEPNLIFVSREGNQRKKEQIYNLKNLHPTYLKHQFGTSDVSNITNEIIKTIHDLKENNRLKYFELLNEKEQSCYRHALFLDPSLEARRTVENALVQQRKSLVNGTQSWFVRETVVKIQNLLEKWCTDNNVKLAFKTESIKTEFSHPLRTALAKVDPAFDKKEHQPVASHAMDALCIYAAACANENVCEFIDGNRTLCEEKNAEELIKLFPQKCGIIRIEAKNIVDKKDFGSRAIFKESIYAENYLPILVCNNTVRLGYSLPNKDSILDKKFKGSILVSEKTPGTFLNKISSYLEEEIDENAKIKTYHINKEKAFVLAEKVAHSQCTDEEIEMEKLLESFSYITVKTPVENLILDVAKSKFNTKEKVLNEKRFSCNPKFTSKAFKYEGTVLLPFIKEWQNLCERPEIKDLFDKAYNKNTDPLAFLNKVWKQGSKRPHSAVRRTFSLPICPDHGALFRIQRTSMIDNKALYQTVDSNQKFQGFSLDKEKNLDWSSPVVFKELQKKTVTELGGKFVENTGFIPMSQYRIVARKNDVIISIAPGTNDRRYIRISAPFTIISKWLADAGNGDTVIDKWNLPDSVKLANPAAFTKSVSPELSPIMGKARSNLFMESVGDIVTFRYIVESSNVEMKKAYNNANE